MKLKFVKENDNVEAYIVNGDAEIQFEYIKFIELLYSREELESTEYIGDITEQEKAQIDEMISEINNKVIRKIEVEASETEINTQQ